MLTQEENELLTRVGPGTPMGGLFRRFWIPVLLASELPEPDGPPVRLTLLGEHLVAFRDTQGRVGLLDTYCSHRGANLYWGRNEDGGLRCVYHGWKYDVEGNCVDMPNEPPHTADFGLRSAERTSEHWSIRNPQSAIKHLAYPAQEAGGVIWAYMGPPALRPELPQYEWTLVPESYRYVHKRFQACNYLQNVEGEVDSSHVSFLHRRLRQDETSSLTVAGQQLLARATDHAPVFHVRETDYGLIIGARRDWDAQSYYWRITQFLMPCATMIPSEPDRPISYTAAIPMDDERMWGFTVTWRPDRPLSTKEIANIESWTGIYAEVDPTTFRPVANMANEYRIDRGKQRTESFSGIRGIREQDMAVQEDQRGPIGDRTRERLGSADMAVIAMRVLMLRMVRDLQRGVEPAMAANSTAFRVRSAAALLPRDVGFEAVPERLGERLSPGTGEKLSPGTGGGDEPALQVRDGGGDEPSLSHRSRGG